MARILKLIQGDREVKPPQSEVDAYVQLVHDTDGSLLVYLYNYKEGGPAPGDSPTQSMHFDLNAARAFKRVLEEAFGPL
ncbi:hypothetical protein GCM10010458_22720 [Microbacterium luteolum]|uniref:Uncharacterized protein n=1 Tax=Microbacterium luteolum TaxID=69367 RepID=A0ABY7XRW9_MICLT|nr:hypothetical protein [Microbacterium luteolum]WDM44925.1 hypothetical protein KV395_17450 [Microbacterium luteolum]